MNSIETLEMSIISQLERLDEADESNMKETVNKSRALCDLANSFTDIQRMKLEIQRQRLDTAKFLKESNGAFKEYLGIEEAK